MDIVYQFGGDKKDELQYETGLESLDFICQKRRDQIPR